MVFFDWLDCTQELTSEEKGRLIDAMVSYARGNDVKLDGNERFVFPAMRQQLDRDAKAYDEKVSRLQENGRKGGRPRKNNADSEKANALSENQIKQMVFPKSKKSQDKDKDKYLYNIDRVDALPETKPTQTQAAQSMRDATDNMYD